MSRTVEDYMEVLEVEMTLGRTLSHHPHSNAVAKVRAKVRIVDGRIIPGAELRDGFDALRTRLLVELNETIDQQLEQVGVPAVFSTEERYLLAYWETMNRGHILPENVVDLKELPGEWYVYPKYSQHKEVESGVQFCQQRYSALVELCQRRCTHFEWFDFNDTSHDEFADTVWDTFSAFWFGFRVYERKAQPRGVGQTYLIDVIAPGDVFMEMEERRFESEKANEYPHFFMGLNSKHPAESSDQVETFGQRDVPVAGTVKQLKKLIDKRLKALAEPDEPAPF